MFEFTASKDMKKLPSTLTNERFVSRKVGRHPYNLKSSEIHGS